MFAWAIFFLNPCVIAPARLYRCRTSQYRMPYSPRRALTLVCRDNRLSILPVSLGLAPHHTPANPGRHESLLFVRTLCLHFLLTSMSYLALHISHGVRPQNTLAVVYRRTPAAFCTLSTRRTYPLPQTHNPSVGLGSTAPESVQNPAHAFCQCPTCTTCIVLRTRGVLRTLYSICLRCELKPVHFSAVRIKTGSFFSGAN